MDFADLFDNGFGSSTNDLARRGCLECGTDPPVCPVCAAGQTCVQRIASCHQCPMTTCVPNALSGAAPYKPPVSQQGGGGPNIGAIVGGVVGGLVLIAVATGLIWHFCIKARRQQWEDEVEHDYEPYMEKSSSGGYMPSPNPDRAPSVRTRQSVASTAYTRGSNVIQIAFIPGITGRYEEEAAFVPPVPPIPAASPIPQSPQSPYTDYSEDHYFMPGDLRDSTYSGFTDDGASTMNRQSNAASIAPSLLRQSVSSTIYGGNTVENPMPVQTAQRGRPLMVSVKSSANTSRSASVATPAVPKINYERFAQPDQSATAAGQTSSATPTVTTKNSTSSFKSAGPGAQTPKARTPHVALQVADTPAEQTVQPGQPDLKAVIEEATRQASRQPLHGGLGSVKREPSPFSDEHRLSPPSGPTSP